MDQPRGGTESTQEKGLKKMASGPVAAPLIKQRLNVNIPESARADLDNMVQTSGRSITELVRLGLSLAKVVLQAVADGHKVVILMKDGHMRELVIP